MFDKNKDFNIFKFCQSIYTKRKEQEFLKTIVDYSIFFHPLSIFNRELLILKHYSKQTIESVISNLGYTLVSYKVIPNSGLYGLIHGSSCIIVLDIKDDQKLVYADEGN